MPDDKTGVERVEEHLEYIDSVTFNDGDTCELGQEHYEWLRTKLRQAVELAKAVSCPANTHDANSMMALAAFLSPCDAGGGA